MIAPLRTAAWPALALLCGVALLVKPAAADNERDPTAWPPALRGAMAAASAASGPSLAADATIRQVVMANGRAYVVHNARRYGVGDQLDGARIERITEQAVWLREAGQLRREPLYGGVEKRQPAPSPDTKRTKEKP